MAAIALFLKICFYFLLLFGVFCYANTSLFPESRVLSVWLLDHPPFRGEEITLDLPNTRGTLPSQQRNSNQKVKARKDAFAGVSFAFGFVLFLF